MPIPPEDLEPKAALICTAEALAVEPVGNPQSFTYYKDFAPLEQPYRARLKILHVFKGEAPVEIDLIFRTDQGNIANGPMHISVQPGKRYRCYLKPGDKPDQYVSVLEGKIDDQFAVFPLCADEKDDSPCLTKVEAIRLARDYVEKQKPGNTYDWKNVSTIFLPDFKGSFWSVNVTNPAGESAMIHVRGDRTIDPKFTQVP